jgi:cellulose synthase/poly-beta-1,6-N-acetylglucosamine synthase-like glycosyltransferase
MEEKYVSIIVPAYRDWERLSLCVAALSVQTYPKDKFEVIMVNNDPNDKVPKDFWLPDNFQIITEATPGSYAARNAALKIAKGEVIAFTDSDCIPDKNWIKNAIDYFNKNKSISRIAGNVTVFPKSSSPTVAEKYDRLYAFRQKRYVSSWGTCVTANMITYKKVFDQIGFFDGTKMTWEDINWGIRANNAGFKMDFVENVVVNHPARNLKELIKKERRLGGNNVVLKNKQSRSSIFLKFLNDIRPRIGDFKFIYSQGKGLNAIDKINVLILRRFLLSIRAYENLRVQMGKKPNRE